MKKRTIAGLVSLTAAGLGAVGGVAALGNLLYSKAIVPVPIREEKTDRWTVQQEGRLWAREGSGFRAAAVRSADGLNLWGAYLLHSEACHRWAICLHGYHDTHESMGAVALHYAQEGWNILLPDQRSHGNSQGTYVGWGWDERLDLLAWINYIIRRDPEAEIILHGVSMGAATVLMATGGPLPPQVKAAVSDCSYTNMEQELKHMLNRRMRKSMSIPAAIPYAPLFAALRKTTLRRAGYDLRDASPIDAVANSKTPTLFIHGVQDEVVPPAMMGRLYQAAACPKQFFWAENAGHTEALGADPEQYWSRVSAFLKTYC
ncbi:MAG: alpha/beta hydrolase [Oscillospiraceae bacterium]|nr:alpha/beta hydrolase [Oscillospiraceae bacterium]